MTPRIDNAPDPDLIEPIIATPVINNYYYNGDEVTGWRSNQWVSPLLIAAVSALVASVWVLGLSVSALKVSDAQQEKRIDRLEAPRFRGEENEPRR